MAKLKWTILITLLLSCVYCVAGHSFISKTFDQLDSTLSIVYVNDYLTAVVWKNVAENFNLNSAEDVSTLMKQQNLLDIAFIPASSKMSTLWTKLNSNFYQGRIVNFYGFVKGYGQRFHILEDFDMIITSRNLFLENFRNYQKGIGKRTTNGHLYETLDFKFIDLHPFTVYQVDENAPGLNLSISVHQPSCNSSLLTSFDYEPTLFNSFRIMKEEKMISDHDVEALKVWNSFPFKYLSKTNQDVIKQEIQSNYGLSSNSSLESLESLFLPSNCHNCRFEYCSEIVLNDIEYWLIPQTLIVIIHFIFLFFTGALRQPSVKRRLITPYLPLTIIIIELSTSDMFWLVLNLSLAIAGIVLNFCILVHFFTYLRLYFLHNLYRLFSLSKNINSTFLKLSGIIPGMVITLILPLFLHLIISIPYVAMYYIVELAPNIVFNILSGISIGIACILGFLVISIDFILNLKKWKQKGLRYMLFFDDPFLIRVDMILLSFNIIILIIISAISDHHVIYFFRLIMFILFCLVSGGSCVIKYLIDKISSSNSQKVEFELEIYLKHQDFKELFREYCVKELSLENYNFFTFLMELKSKSKKKLTIELMDEISKVYLSQNSSFELNISSPCRKNFSILRKKVENQNVELSTDSNQLVTIQDLISLFEVEVLANLRDTFSRMENTNEFKTWLYAFKVQQENNIL